MSAVAYCLLAVTFLSGVQALSYVPEPCDTSQKAFACEMENLNIVCPKDHKIFVENALFGRSEPDMDVCPFGRQHREDTDCAAGNSTEVVTHLCNDKKHCKVQATKKLFGDPCSGTYKYLEVTYQCKPEGPPWSECSVTCGEGVQTRINITTLEQSTRPCDTNVECCCLPWEEWGQCTCNGEPQQRTRQQNPRATCACTETIETRACSTSTYALISGNVYRVPDSALTDSSHHSHCPAAFSRINDCPDGRTCCSWTWPSRIDPPGVGDWVQADLGQVFYIRTVAIRGRGSYGQYCTAFKAGFSIDGSTFTYTQELQGNTDETSVVKHNIQGDQLARYVRIQPTSWVHGHAALRWEVYGCPAQP